jgi:phage terminase large subunit-like protein
VGSDRVWYAGLDLAQTWDCNAFVAVSKAPDGVFDVMCRFWIPGQNAGVRAEKDGVPYPTWAADPANHLTMTPGTVCDYDFIRRDILQFCKERTVRCIAADPHNSHYLVQQLQDEGLTVQGFSQGYSMMNNPTRALDALICQGRLRTSDNKVLNWMAGNAVTKESSDGYIKISKPAPMSPSKVDGMVALVMALALAMESEVAPSQPSPEIVIL